MTQFWHRTIETPDGPFTVITDENAVICSGWTDDVQALFGRLHLGPLSPTDLMAPPRLGQAIEAVEAYYDGDAQLISQVACRQVAAPFHAQVRRVLAGVPYGSRVSYTKLAGLAGNDKAARAAASACAQNLTALFVPCHRVVRGDGSLGGFRYGLALKQRLLDRESAVVSGL